MKTILEFSVVFVTSILPQIVGVFLVNETKANLDRFSTLSKLLNGGVYHIGKILLILYIASNQVTGLSSIGLSFKQTEFPKVITVGILVTGYLSLTFVTSRLHSKKTQEEGKARQDEIFKILGYSAYKTIPEKFISLIDLWLGIAAEELIYRGYLILVLGMRTGTFLPWIILSITLSGTVHLYQGFKWRIFFVHIFFAGVFVIALMTTKNIVAAFVPHLVYDTIWLFQRWTNAPKQEIEQQPEPVG